MGDGKRGGDRGGDERENRGWGRDLEGVGCGWGWGAWSWGVGSQTRAWPSNSSVYAQTLRGEMCVSLD